ncbi:MAG: GNAT family N-acetyltransferase [Clostridium celatum]|nr:GNAT family N-acetyltransferase [Clostridium celatum]MDU2121035.1 GNAT family N-acetyltransferase [Clostridium celatum]MDU4980600.1 GNAT family N-acetyltransferase [Clostridium celatum]
MNNILNLKRKDGIEVKAELKVLNISYLDKIMELQKIIIDGLENKELYADTEREEFEDYIKKNGKILGCVTEDDELIAMGVYAKKGYYKSNYGYDIGLENEELLKVGQIESTVVKEEYRGNKLQKIICEELEKIAVKEDTKILCATASPYNEFSVNTFKNLGYEIKKDKLKYGGLRRYVLAKRV